MLGGGITLKLNPLLGWPPTVTTTLPMPGVAPTGTVAAIDVSLQLLTFADAPLTVTVLAPWGEPKRVPLMMIAVFAGPELGDTPVMLGSTVKSTPLLATPPTVTTTFPVVAAAGTVTASEVSLQVFTIAVVPLNVTVLELGVAPKLVPVIVIDEAA
jgi:hypothetical protein